MRLFRRIWLILIGISFLVLLASLTLNASALGLQSWLDIEYTQRPNDPRDIRQFSRLRGLLQECAAPSSGCKPCQEGRNVWPVVIGGQCVERENGSRTVCPTMASTKQGRNKSAVC
ncbi:unnamed protein product [Protopolystoma xenopodis]|uniref:Uncharacterized protein n=1 Tax=Protopolystoma xenopodis TaxID=117903 RepID=A0A3S5BGG2_9PLAT|nr:unnamed protein product [Protopolystoma xenopodis]